MDQIFNENIQQLLQIDLPSKVQQQNEQNQKVRQFSINKKLCMSIMVIVFGVFIIFLILKQTFIISSEKTINEKEFLEQSYKNLITKNEETSNLSHKELIQIIQINKESNNDDEKHYSDQKINNQLKQNSKRRLLITNQVDKTRETLIEVIEIIINFTTQLANTLKILFQLTAMLFILTDLINFWGLASIYIFLPIQIPIFAKNILQNAWTNFNQPILQYLGLQINIPSLNSQSQNFINSNPGLESYLKLQILQIMFQPVVVFSITALELLLFNMILNHIKKKFRLIRKHIKQEHIKQKFKRLKNKEIILNAIKNQVINSKKNKIIKQKTQNHQMVLQQKVKTDKISQEIQDETSSKIIQLQRKIEVQEKAKTKVYLNKNQKQYNIRKDKQKDKKDNNFDLQQQKNKENNNFFMSELLRLVIQKQSSKKKHWSEQISVNKLQIFSALIISYMPQILLPLYQSFFNTRCTNILAKGNLQIYYFLLGLILVYPFIYLMTNYNSLVLSKNTKKDPRLKKPKIGIKSRIKNSIKQLKKQTVQTFFQFFLNMSIPILVGMTSSPVLFLSINLIMLISYIFLDITFHKGNSCKSKTQKINNIVQKITFLCYHVCFLFLYLFNKFKASFLEMNILTVQEVDRIFNYFGIAIVFLFAFGGIHEMIQFLLTFMYNLCKIIYMIFRVCLGNYQIQKVKEQPQIQQRDNQNQKNQNKSGKKKNKLPKIDRLNSQKQEGLMIVPRNTDTDNLTQIQEQFEIQILKNKIHIQKMKLRNKIIFQQIDKGQSCQSPQRQHEYKIYPLGIQDIQGIQVLQNEQNEKQNEKQIQNLKQKQKQKAPIKVFSYQKRPQKIIAKRKRSKRNSKQNKQT